MRAKHCGDVPASTLLAIPAEIRMLILEHLFAHELYGEGYSYAGEGSGLMLDESYSSHDKLQCLLTCRQMYNDASLLAFKRTSFIVANMFVNIPARLATLSREQVQAIRSIAFVADARHLRKMHISYWGRHAFGMDTLNLDTLTIILHRWSTWHYLFDFTTHIVQLLRHLKGVKSLVIMRNKASVKGGLKTWYNRLVGLMLKIDHLQRYDVNPPRPESTWWTWSFDDRAQVIRLDARPAKPLVDEMKYINSILPLVEELRTNVEKEDLDPDARHWAR